jgi:hypothetical protein
MVLVLATCGRSGHPVAEGPDAGGSRSVCGGIGGIHCVPSEYCAYAPDCGSGIADGSGICLTRPESCPVEPTPICGCSGFRHLNACAVYMSGSDVTTERECEEPAESFECGPGRCESRHQYCQRQVSDVPGTPDSFTCRRLRSCPILQGCACLAAEPCGADCNAEEGGYRLTCTGG